MRSCADLEQIEEGERPRQSGRRLLAARGRRCRPILAPCVCGCALNPLLKHQQKLSKPRLFHISALPCQQTAPIPSLPLSKPTAKKAQHFLPRPSPCASCARVCCAHLRFFKSGPRRRYEEARRAVLSFLSLSLSQPQPTLRYIAVRRRPMLRRALPAALPRSRSSIHLPSPPFPPWLRPAARALRLHTPL